MLYYKRGDREILNFTNNNMIDLKIGYSTTTYRKQLYSRHLDWIKQTKTLYNDVLAFYYQILMKQPQLLSLSSYELLRTLEILTIGTKEMKKKGDLPEIPLTNFPKLPLYFRRAAINAAIGITKSFLARYSLWQEQYGFTGKETGCPQPATQFHSSPLYYQGMYRNWKEDMIELKLWTGSRWIWTRYRMKGRTLPKQGKRCSPSIKVFQNRAELHIPVEQPVTDIRKLSERMKLGESICAVSLPNQDTLAVCIHMNKQEQILHSLFIKGGTEIKHRKEVLLHNKNGDDLLSSKIRQKIGQIHEDCAHKISKQIVEFAKEVHASVIVVPNYGILNQKKDCYNWIGRNIIKKISYKAFQKGILLVMVSIDNLLDVCAVCGAKFLKLQSEFICPNGHCGNTAWNITVQVGKIFLKSYK